VSAQPLSCSPAPCPVCDTAVGADLARCPECGFDLAGIGGRPGLTRPVFVLTAMGFLAVYLITLAIVAMTR
jgi:hypothetical protein